LTGFISRLSYISYLNKACRDTVLNIGQGGSPERPSRER
jgi:hypothetical protein